MVYIQSFGTRSTTPFNCFTYSTHPGVVNRYRINQAIPSAPSASYDDPSPYDTAGDTPTSTPLPTDTSDADTDGATTPQDVLSSDPPTVSLIQVTALPPATTSPQAVLPKLPYHRQLNVLYLIPLFVALGVVLGAITAVILLKWRENRRRLLPTSTLLPGPPYVPPENDVEERLLVHGYPSMEQVSLFAAATPSKFTIHGSRYIPKRTFAWQTLDATQPPYSQPTYTQTIIPSSDGERFTVVTEEDPFLATSPMVVRQSPKPSDDASLPNIRISPPFSAPTSKDNSGHLKAQYTNVPKPFRRSMFDILKLKGPSLPVPSARKTYTVLRPDDEPADKTPTNPMRRVSSLKTTLAHERRSRSARRSLDGGSYISDTEDALGLLGSQDEKHDLADAPVNLPKQTLRLKDGTLSPPTRSEKMKKPRKVTPFASEPKGSPKEAIFSEDEPSTRRGNEIEEEKHPDIYTKAPQRRHSRTPRKELSTSSTSRRSSAPDTHASVLPLSPPSLMSPPLEKSLFFTSPLSSSASLAGRMNPLASTRPSSLHHVDRSPELCLFPLPSKKTKATKKLRTSRPEPPLPYPPYPDNDHVKSTPRERPISANIKWRSVSPGSPVPKGRSTSAAHRESTTGVCSLGSLSPTSLATALACSSSSDILNKVNDIVALGYTKQRTSMGGAGGKVAASLPDVV
jgi:hypothetical protein